MPWSKIFQTKVIVFLELVWKHEFKLFGGIFWIFLGLLLIGWQSWAENQRPWNVQKSPPNNLMNSCFQAGSKKTMTLGTSPNAPKYFFPPEWSPHHQNVHFFRNNFKATQIVWRLKRTIKIYTCIFCLDFLNKVSKGDLKSLAYLALTIFACFGGVFFYGYGSCTSELQLKVNCIG